MCQRVVLLSLKNFLRLYLYICHGHDSHTLQATRNQESVCFPVSELDCDPGGHSVPARGPRLYFSSSSH